MSASPPPLSSAYPSGDEARKRKRPNEDEVEASNTSTTQRSQSPRVNANGAVYASNAPSHGRTSASPDRHLLYHRLVLPAFNSSNSIHRPQEQAINTDLHRQIRLLMVTEPLQALPLPRHSSTIKLLRLVRLHNRQVEEKDR